MLAKQVESHDSIWTLKKRGHLAIQERMLRPPSWMMEWIILIPIWCTTTYVHRCLLWDTTNLSRMPPPVTISAVTIAIPIHATRTIGSIGKTFFSLTYAHACQSSHGTRCAGEIAAARDNNICGVGVAYDSMVAGKSFCRFSPRLIFSNRYSYVGSTIHDW